MQQINGIPIPKDLTPLQRAQLKAYWHLGCIALFNAGLSLLTLLNQNKTLTWQMVLISIAGQVILAAMDVFKKYCTASGDVPLSIVANAGSTAVANAIKPENLANTEKQIEQAASSVVAYIPPAPANVAPSVAAPVAPSYHPPMEQVDMVNTLPNIGIVQRQS